MDVEKILVNMRLLDSLLRETGIVLIDILTVDTEGWELEVLSGLNFNLHAPKLLVVENWLRDENILKKSLVTDTVSFVGCIPMIFM
jgi:hypothetical protein